MKSDQGSIVHYDADSDALYISLRKGAEEEFREVAPGVSVELDEKGDILGIEILDASEILRPYFAPQFSTREKQRRSAVAVA